MPCERNSAAKGIAASEKLRRGSRDTIVPRSSPASETPVRQPADQRVVSGRASLIHRRITHQHRCDASENGRVSQFITFIQILPAIFLVLGRKRQLRTRSAPLRRKLPLFIAPSKVRSSRKNIFTRVYYLKLYILTYELPIELSNGHRLHQST